MGYDQLYKVALRLKKSFLKGWAQTLWKGLGYAVLVVMAFAAVVNIVVGIIAGLEGEWGIALGLIFLGAGAVLLTELLFNYFFPDTPPSS